MDENIKTAIGCSFIIGAGIFAYIHNGGEVPQYTRPNIDHNTSIQNNLEKKTNSKTGSVFSTSHSRNINAYQEKPKNYTIHMLDTNKYLTGGKNER